MGAKTAVGEGNKSCRSHVSRFRLLVRNAYKSFIVEGKEMKLKEGLYSALRSQISLLWADTWGESRQNIHICRRSFPCPDLTDSFLATWTGSICGSKLGTKDQRFILLRKINVVQSRYHGTLYVA